MTLKNSIYADVWRIYNKTGLYYLLKALLVLKPFRPIFTYRLGRAAKKLPVPFKVLVYIPLKLLHRWFTGALCCEIPFSAQIGPGFRLNHGYVVVLNKHCKIGSNFTCLHNVTIGGVRESGVPVLGDNVVMAANTMVAGNVNVGNGATIGAGALVLKDVPDMAIVIGNPQRVSRYSDLPRTPNAAPDYLLE